METQRSTDKNCFMPLAGMKRVYEPGCGLKESVKKHPCPDCHFCQSCSDARCHSCRGKMNRSKEGVSRKLSLREQILLFEKINAG